jgi:hypothetical protein
MLGSFPPEPWSLAQPSLLGRGGAGDLIQSKIFEILISIGLCPMILFSTQDSKERPMETFAKLFGSLLALVYHCFDRIVILGHLPLLTRPENIVYFFRDVHHVGAITKEVLRQRTNDYHRWVDAFASNHKIPMEWGRKRRPQGRLRPSCPAAHGTPESVRSVLYP